MKKLLVSLLAALALWATTAIAQAPTTFLTPEQMKHEAEALGFPTTDVQFVVDDTEQINAFFFEGGEVCMWMFCQEFPRTLGFLGDWSGTPYELRLFVFYHELGHYHQFLAGRPYDEWEADLFAVKAFCRQGREGIYWGERAASFIVNAYGGEWGRSGPVHGSWMQRVENMKAKGDCGARGPQSE